MVVYIILLLLPMMVQHVVVGKKNLDYEKKNRWALWLFFFMLTILVMLRHESVGNDTRNYIYFFERYASMDWKAVGKESREVGFSYFNKIVSLFTQTPQVFLAITVIVTTAMIYPTYKRLNTDTSFVIIVFSIMSTFVMMFSGIRQMLAVGLGFAAYELTRRKKLIPFIIVVMVAMSFHLSAIMLVFMYPLYHVKITKKWLIFVVPVLALMFLLNEQIFAGLAVVIEQYAGYDSSITQTGAYTMLVLFGLFAVFAFLIPDEKLLDEETIGLRNYLLFALVLQMFAPLHVLAMRMNYYYIIFIPLLLPRIVECRSERWKQVAVLARHVLIVFFLLYFFLIKANSDNNLHVFPYHFFWETVS